MPTDAILPAEPLTNAAPVSAPGPQRTVFVTAVLVAHDGATWLPCVLAALEAQTRAPDIAVAVDSGSEDDSRDLLSAALGPRHVLGVESTAGFGSAVRRGLAHADALGSPSAMTTDGDRTAEWVWLLHDDAEPAPDALEHLIAEVVRDPSTAVAGPKLLGWYDRRLLLEVGVTIARSGRRETLLERREEDQGQHDGTRQVLAVSTAGMLVRRDVWEKLGGLDPDLPLLRDDVDFGWRVTLAGHRVVCVTDAVLHHAEAAARSRRPIAVRAGRDTRSIGRLHRLDRQNALRVLVTNLPLAALPLALLRLTLGTLIRAVGLLLGKLPTYALDELLAWFAVMGRPDRIVVARAARRATRGGPTRAAHALLAPRGSGLRHLMETVNLLVGPGPAAAAGGAHRAVETGPTSDVADELPRASGGAIRRRLVRPGVLLPLALTVLSLLACRSLLGDGRLMGGALLPAPDTAGELWRTYTQAWHPVGVGSTTDSPPYLAVLAALSSVLLGKASLAVTVLVLGAVPLSGLSAYLAVRPVVPSPPLRVWAAVTYALLPPTLGAVAAGRLSTLAVAVLLPVTALTASRAVGTGERPGSVRSAWGAGLLLALLAAFAPATYVLALVLLLVAAAVVLRGLGQRAVRWRTRLRNGALLRLGIIAVVPPVLLMPWLPAVIGDPALLLLEAGFPGPGLTDPHLPPAALFLLQPGGPGMYPMLVTLGLLLGGLAGLLRGDRRRLVLAGWCAALIGLAGALVQSRIRVTAPTLETGVPAWTGPTLLLAGAGLVLAASVGAVGARTRIAQSNFGWRQPVALALTVLAGLVPVLAAGWWVVAGAGDPLQRQDPVLLPAFIAAEGAQPGQPRTLVLRQRAGGRISFALLRADGPRLGDAETATPADQRIGLDRAVADLASGRGGEASAALLPYGIRFVLMSRPLDLGLARDIDALPGLVRVSGPEGSIVWRVQFPSGRLRVLPGRQADPAAATVLPAGPVRAVTTVEPGTAGRLLVVADQRDAGWRASLDGRSLPRTTYDGWAQAFLLPTDGGRLVLRHDEGARPALLWTQGVALLLVVVLVLPSARREELPADSDDPRRLVADEDEDEVTRQRAVREPAAAPGARRRT